VETFLPLIEKYAGDERNCVKKAVNWALRNIGKRNAFLRGEVLRVTDTLARSDWRAARWIASDTSRDLGSPAAMRRLERTKDR